jgi:uncharacterized protein
MLRELPMFPLGAVLFPHMVLPLHVFEPRYRALLDDVLEDGSEFGVVLISRGHEVGGGDVRTDVGTVARILRAEQLDEDRWFVIAVGTRRFRVEGWLPDAPYPRAEVVFLDDDPLEEHEQGPGEGNRDGADHDGDADDDVTGALAALVPGLRRVLALQAELGQDNVPATFELAEDPSVASWQAAILSPLTSFDAQRILASDDRLARLTLIAGFLDEIEATLRFQLQQDG